MKKLMKTTISTLSVLLFLASTAVIAQQSDYQIQQDFRTEYKELATQIDNATSTEELESAYAEISEFEAKYSGYSSLINSALYPETFEERISDLQSRYGISETNVNVVNQLNEQIAGLQRELDELRERLAGMDEDSQALRERIERASANERRLSGLVRQYRQNLENRDEFVSEMLEGLLNRYQTMDAQSQAELAEAIESMDDNPLDLLRTILQGYINAADRDAGLESVDFLRMRAQHGYFSNVWDKIGSRLAETFAPDSPVQARQEITDLLSAWQASIDNKLWNALSTSFNQAGIQLSTFTSADAFNNALNQFVDNATEVSRNQNEEADYELYRSFSDFWNNTVKAGWGEFLVAGNVLDQGQIAAIDVKISDWGQAATPTSNLMFILFLVSLAVIIGLIVLLVTKKS